MPAIAQHTKRPSGEISVNKPEGFIMNLKVSSEGYMECIHPDIQSEAL